MLLLFGCILFLAGTVVILLLPVLWAEQTYRTYRDARAVNCPETHARAAVRFNAWRAAWSSLEGPPKLQLSDCTRWPERSDCGQECIPDALRAEPSGTAEYIPWRTRRIVHMPVLLAAAAAWVLGVAWHSEYVFRPRWMAALGLSDPQTRALARTMAPHLVSVGACILFAYGVAGLLRWLGSRTLTHGLEVSAAVWLVTFAALMAATRSQLSLELLWIEGGYTFLAALLMGAIVGGAPRWVIVGDPRERGHRNVA